MLYSTLFPISHIAKQTFVEDLQYKRVYMKPRKPDFFEGEHQLSRTSLYQFFLCLWFCSICLYCPKCPNCPIFSKLYNLSYLFQFCPKSPILSKVSKMSKVSNSVQRVQNVLKCPILSKESNSV